MILRSIRVQGWRCFGNPVHVGPFSEGLNVLHAPNATGKSTLFEALLRALLDGHRVSGREVEAIRPWGRSLAPTVTVEFAHEGTEYRLMKRFLDRPSSELERREENRFVRMAEGEAADQKVRDILTRNPPGKGLARLENWGLAQVLWAPQGNLAVSKLSGDIVADIRTSLGVQVAGPGTGPLEERIKEAYLRSFTPGGKLRTGKDASSIVRLREKLEAAKEKQRKALEQQQAFEEASRKVEDLRARRAQARRDAEAFTKALSEARARTEEYKNLRGEEAQRKDRVKTAEAQYNELSQRMDAIKATNKELQEAQEILRQLQVDLPLRIREVAEREKEAAKAKSLLEDARKGRQVVDEARSQADLARRYLEGVSVATELGKKLRRIAEANDTIARKKKERAALVAPDTKTLRAIRKAIKDHDDAQVRLEAALITLEIVPEKKGSVVIVAGEEMGTRGLSPGNPIQVKGSPEVVVHLQGIARIRARGPSGSIAEIRDERHKAVSKIKELTKGFGTTDLEELESLNEKAMKLEEAIAEAETQVKTLLSGDSVEDIESQQTRVTAVLAEILENHPDWHDQPPDAGALEAKAEQTQRAFIETVESTEAKWEAAQSALTAAVEHKAGLGARLQETGRQVNLLESRLTELTSDGKQDSERQAELRKIALSWDAAQASLEEAQKSLTAFGADPIDEVTKLEKQLRSADEAATKALEEEKLQEGRLEHLSAQGPYSVLARAEEEVAHLREEIEAEEQYLAAVRLLFDTVEESRAKALLAVTGPVEAAATRTLQRIAGGRLGRVQLDEGFEPAHVRPDLAESPVTIECVSGGEREQIYLATRLALADVITKDQRQLVVLDDVLTATDAGRLARVMTILEEAAQRLQILVLTCHPERYGGLQGARFIDLEAIARNGTEA